jgi:hypothetical protein
MSIKHIKYAGAGFKTKASPSKINRFVQELPTEQRQSLYQVSEELQSAGLIEPTGEFTKEHAQNLYTGD